MHIQNYPIRECDEQGCGYFGASRGSRKHVGIDIECSINAPILSPISGVVTKVGFPYSDEDKKHFRYIEVTKDDYRFRFFYLSPVLKVGDDVDAGDLLGYSQDLTTTYKGIAQHCHFEVKDKEGNHIDPTPVYLALNEEIYGV